LWGNATACATSAARNRRGACGVFHANEHAGAVQRDFATSALRPGRIIWMAPRRGEANEKARDCRMPPSKGPNHAGMIIAKIAHVSTLASPY
jgi:hypothetical protein